LLIALLTALSHGAQAQSPTDPECYLPDADRQQLDKFEGHALKMADKLFSSQGYKQAEAEYDAFLFEYPKSKAIPYALVRKGRCRQLSKDRDEEIRINTERPDPIVIYNKVLDFYPEAVNCAAASLYYIGSWHVANDNSTEAIKAFTELAKDKDYRQHRLAAPGTLTLADLLLKQEKVEDALTYLEQVAADFRTRITSAAGQAIQRVVSYRVRGAPDEKRLRDFYVKVKGFGEKPAAVKDADKVFEDRDYAEQVRRCVVQHGNFDVAKDRAQAELRDKYYKYWVSVFENKLPAWDEFQLQIFGWQRVYEGPEAESNWVQRVDAQFRREDPTFDRTLWWIQNCWGKNVQQKVTEYYNLIDFTKADNPKILTLMTTLYDNCGMQALGLKTYDKFNFEVMPDDQKEALVQWFVQRKKEDYVKKALSKLKDRSRADYVLLTYLVGAGDSGQGIPQADVVAKTPQYASYALWEKANFLKQQNKFAEAIASYSQVTNRGAETFYRIADCHTQLGQADNAVKQLREVEKSFNDQNAKACYMIAGIYASLGRTNDQAQVLYELGLKYKESGEAKRALDDLKRLGLPTTKN